MPTAVPKLTPEEQKKLMVNYMLHKVDLEDWHGVADAAMDLRELEAAHPELKKQ